MKPAILAAVLVLACSAAGAGMPDEYVENFDNPQSRALWFPAAGEWTLNPDGGFYLHERSPDEGHYAWTISYFQIADGRVEARAAAVRRNERSGGNFGLMLKYVDRWNWIALRFGAYGGLSLRVTEDGEGRNVPLLRWSPEINRFYRAGAVIRGGSLEVFIDSETVASADELPFAGVSGYTGFFTLGSSAYDYFAVSRE